MAKKKLGIPTEVIQYATCNKCHKLYDINEYKTEVQTCSFINYLNHTIEYFQQKCNNPLTKKINSNNEQILRLIMTYPLVNIRQQLTLFLAGKILRCHVENGQKERMIPKQCSISTMKGFEKDLQMMIAFFYKGTC